MAKSYFGYFSWNHKSHEYLDGNLKLINFHIVFYYFVAEQCAQFSLGMGYIFTFSLCRKGKIPYEKVAERERPAKMCVWIAKVVMRECGSHKCIFLWGHRKIQKMYSQWGWSMGNRIQYWRKSNNMWEIGNHVKFYWNSFHLPPTLARCNDLQGIINI